MWHGYAVFIRFLFLFYALSSSSFSSMTLWITFPCDNQRTVPFDRFICVCVLQIVSDNFQFIHGENWDNNHFLFFYYLRREWERNNNNKLVWCQNHHANEEKKKKYKKVMAYIGISVILYLVRDVTHLNVFLFLPNVRLGFLCANLKTL